MSVKEKAIKGLDLCSSLGGIENCETCPYGDVKYNEETGDCLHHLFKESLNVIKAYDFALSQYKETLEELIENNDGDVKEICVFLHNLLRIKEVDIEKGFYI